MGLERPKVLEPYGFATKSLKISDWMSQMFGVLRSADESNQIHIDENDSVLASYNTESELLDFFRRSYTAARGKRFMFVYALLAGVHSPSFYAQFESLADVVIDFARREEQGAERQYARIRIARGSPQYNSNWRALEILDNGGIELTKSGQHGLPAGKKTQTERKLAAIMFTDMVGYTTLAQSNEALALEILERHNKLLRRLFSVYKGREVKTIGDSFLVEFESALDAVQCAIEIQKLLHGRSISRSRENQKIRLRIGVHLGDVERKGGDIFGDAVNIASRIQPLASAEGVCISEQVFDQIHNKIDYRLERLDERGLKNVTFHTKVYSIILPWTEKKKGKITHDLDNSKR